MGEITKEYQKIKIFCDSASIQDMEDYVGNSQIQGFTSNPTLARNAGIKDYLEFAHKAAETCGDKEISIEVIADDNVSMIRQGLLLSQIRENISVKIPVTNSKGISTNEVIRALVNEGCYLNVTAVFSLSQSNIVLEAMEKAERGILSIFAGRIADTGIDPIPHVLNITKMRDELSPKIAVLWASPREPLNLIHAIQSKADIITMTPTLINKVKNFGKDLDQYSLETVQMFTNDALDSGFQL